MNNPTPIANELLVVVQFGILNQCPLLENLTMINAITIKMTKPTPQYMKNRGNLRKNLCASSSALESDEEPSRPSSSDGRFI
jgi:hypothetical protein